MKHYRQTKRILVFVLVFCVLFSSVSAYAYSSPTLDRSKTVINEYEQITKLQKTPDAQLIALGYSQKDIAEIRNFSYRDALYERAQLSEEKLSNLGYSPKQISFMKEFINEPNGDYDFSIMAITLSQTISLVGGANSTTYKTVRYSWSWSAMPLIAKTDAVAVRWRGVDPNGHIIDLVNYSGSANRSAFVSYYYDNGSGSYTTDTITVGSASDYNSLHASFPMSKTSYGDTLWAKSGSLTCKLQLDASNTINYIKFQASYGHKTSVLSFSLGYSYSGDVGVSITPVDKVENYYRTAKISSSVTYL
jgi:hypothetical protein